MRRNRRSSERLSVLLIPAAKGETLSFQTTKRRLLIWLLASFISIGIVSCQVLQGFVGLMLPSSPEAAGADFQALYQQERSQRAQERETLVAENEALRGLVDEMAAEVTERVRGYEEQQRRFIDLTALPVGGEEPPEPSSEEPQASGGRGGPWFGFADDLERVPPGALAIEEQLLTLISLTNSLQTLNSRIDGWHDLLEHTPLLCPIQEPWQVTDEFGSRRHPITGRWDQHEGLDMAARHGVPVLAPADGTVAFAGRRVGYGRLVILDHGTGLRLGGDPIEPQHFRTRFGHLSRILVEEGQQVCRGDVIGEVGSSGYSTGAHLHYEVRIDGEPVDPVEFIVEP